MNNTNLTYHGKVELIKLNKSGRTIGKITLNNSGHDALFEIFAKALVGVYKNEYTPTKVTIDKNGLVIQSSPISGLVYVATSNIVQNPHAKLTAYIPYVSGLTPSQGDTLYLTLRSKETKLASLDISSTQEITGMQPGQSFILNWYLYVDNGTVTNNA